MVGISVQVDLNERCLAGEHVDFIVDRQRVGSAQIGFDDIVSRDVAVGPFVEPQAIGSAYPFGGPPERLFPIGPIAADHILVAAMARLQDERIRP